VIFDPKFGFRSLGMPRVKGRIEQIEVFELGVVAALRHIT